MKLCTAFAVWLFLLMTVRNWNFSLFSLFEDHHTLFTFQICCQNDFTSKATLRYWHMDDFTSEKILVNDFVFANNHQKTLNAENSTQKFNRDEIVVLLCVFSDWWKLRHFELREKNLIISAQFQEALSFCGHPYWLTRYLVAPIVENHTLFIRCESFKKIMKNTPYFLRRIDDWIALCSLNPLCLWL